MLIQKNAPRRASGVLLHPLSLPSDEGVGTFGREAYSFVDWLARAGQSIWQILPLGPTGYGDSPYSAFSATAGNPYAISLRALVQEGDLLAQECAPLTGLAPERVRYDVLYQEKNSLLRLAARRFFSNKNQPPHAARLEEFESFVRREDDWLEDYALFMSAKARFAGAPWQEWPREISLRESGEALLALKNDPEYSAVLYAQWQFFRQWHALRLYAEGRGIAIIGDAPIFVAPDSADVWVGREFFQLDEKGRPLAVAGVPPDYFSPTGQLWGNPLYDWDALKKDGYAWWKARLARLLRLVHRVRIDHFRGFVQYWAVPADAATAISGEWRDGPGADFFKELVRTFGEPLPLIAEDLGLITPDVCKLRDDFSLPGMRIFCFAPWGAPTWNDQEDVPRAFIEHAYVPEAYTQACFAYPGTHDNDTIVGWYAALDQRQRRGVEEYLCGCTESSVARKVVERLLASQAGAVVFLMQDILGLPAAARLNTPGTCDGRNWTWRLAALPDEGTTEWLYAATKNSGRICTE